MSDLIAQGADPQDRWRRPLPADVPQVIGRQAGAWSTPWDERISRRHVEICYQGGKLQVRVLAAARNPVFYRGRKSNDFELKAGEHFVVGGTTFTLADEQVYVSLEVPLPEHERTFTADELRRRPYQRADQRIEVLSRLPDIIGGSSSDSEMFVRLVNLLLSGVPRATAAAIVAVPSSLAAADLNPEPRTLNPVSVLHWDRRILSGTEFRPSERLIRRALEAGQSVVHLWSSDKPRGSEYTLSEGVDWAFCVPVPGDDGPGWVLYVTGGLEAEAVAHRSDPELLRDDVKFTELTAATLSALRASRLLAQRQASLAQFFSPVVMSALEGQDPDEALAPREADVTVLFCDLRGFSRHSERHADHLLELLHRVSEALGVMTRHILAQGGVVGDFHGDSAMGFWGWPIAQSDAVERACRAALAIRAEFAALSSRSRQGSVAGAEAADAPAVASQAPPQPPHPEFGYDFRVGIGIASGRAVAGKIGTVDQVKVTVFGPVANLASRLEALTKVLRVPILMDAATADVVRASVAKDVARVRRLAKIKPAGMETPALVSELLPPASEYPQLSDEHLAAFESAVAALDASDWDGALQLLHRVPPDDLAKDFLTVFIAQHNRTPPADWDGVVEIS
ncbi:MAG TPA: adenylate/guanylate cyclase domain-containing protein [Pirellulaceae bacterium]|nr:adenylate/guanylate cyclase domain-containing protein [Pirellulaceae bacterium]